MYRAAFLLSAILLAPSVASAQQPCTTNEGQVVDELYRHILERSVDVNSRFWENQLRSGSTVKQVVREIVTSPEHDQRFWRTEAGEDTPYFRAVGTLYRHILGRQPDAAGARSWAELGARSGADAVVDRIINSPEYNNRFGDWGVPGSGGLVYCGSTASQAARVSPESSQTASQPANMRFRNLDTNRNGRIEREEWRGGQRAFENQDWNGDGVLSGDEVLPGARNTARRQSRFDLLDTNNTSRIEAREWDGTLAAFDRMDVNNDNRLTLEEFEGTALETTGTSGSLISVNASQPWTDTGLNVRAGEMVTFEADGSVQLSDNFNDVAGVAGLTNRRTIDAPLTRAPAGALIARVGNSSIFLVGNRRQVRAPASGRLYLGVNDDYLADNDGQFRVMVDFADR
jgi:Ca2+-binding EF-hand superfamily protein